MQSRPEKKSSGRAFLYALTALMVVGASAACSSGTQPEEKPTQARIRVEGSAPGPLQLVVSTNFFEVVDQFTGEIRQILNTADTTAIGTLPYDGTVQLTSLGSVYVSVANEDAAAANVRLRVDLDERQAYDRSATMSEGGALIFAFVFLQTVL